MAINVNTVYQTVLLILNKEQRGYMTPTEFNSMGTQVQLEIFEKYFEDLNQQLRVPQTNTDYGNRVENIDNKMSIFKTSGSCVYNVSGYFTLPNIDEYGLTYVPVQTKPTESSIYMISNVAYKNEVEAQRLDKTDFYFIKKSNLTKPSKDFPVYLLEGNKITIEPSDITSDISIDFIRKPKNVHWGFTVGERGQYIYDKTPYSATGGSQDFELHPSEQTDLIIKILLYAGIVIRDPQIVQTAAAKIQAEEVNEKS